MSGINSEAFREFDATHKTVPEHRFTPGTEINLHDDAVDIEGVRQTPTVTMPKEVRQEIARGVFNLASVTTLIEQEYRRLNPKSRIGAQHTVSLQEHPTILNFKSTWRNMLERIRNKNVGVSFSTCGDKSRFQHTVSLRYIGMSNEELHQFHYTQSSRDKGANSAYPDVNQTEGVAHLLKDGSLAFREFESDDYGPVLAQRMHVYQRPSPQKRGFV